MDMIVLAAPRAELAHGYAAIQEIHRRNGGAFDLPEGTVYPVLHRFQQMGWHASRWITAEPGRQ
jgi:PadR family transcriptional regulator PadR